MPRSLLARPVSPPTPIRAIISVQRTPEMEGILGTAPRFTGSKPVVFLLDDIPMFGGPPGNCTPFPWLRARCSSTKACRPYILYLESREGIEPPICCFAGSRLRHSATATSWRSRRVSIPLHSSLTMRRPSYRLQEHYSFSIFSSRISLSIRWIFSSSLGVHRGSCPVLFGLQSEQLRFLRR